MPSGYSSSRHSPTHKRKVRIIKQRDVSRTAIVSLVIAAGVAVAALLIWRVGKSGEEIPVHIRSLREYEMDWRCEGGHFFHSTGRKDSRPCWMCGQPAYPVAHYKCNTHGSYEVAFRFSEDKQGTVKPEQVRVGSGEWIDADDGLKCPRCHLELTQDLIDPLDRAENRNP